MAIEQIYVWNNTSIMQDEVLCHRIGLLPLNIDPRKMKPMRDPKKPHESDTMIFDLRVKCDRNPEAGAGETDPKKKYYDSNVYSGMLEWQPQGDQKTKFAAKRPGPVDPDILLVKLRPGQVGRAIGMSLTVDGGYELFCEKGNRSRPRQMVTCRWVEPYWTGL